MALAATERTPIFYDLPGPYNRYLFDAQGNRPGVSPEWRGLLKHDYTLSYLMSHSYARPRLAGTARRATPGARALRPTPSRSRRRRVPAAFLGLAAKGAGSPTSGAATTTRRARPDDRFGSSARNNFNDAETAQGRRSWLVPLRAAASAGTSRSGYNQWLWGISARRYREPYLSLGYQF